MNKDDERVLVIPEERFRAAGAFTGFRPFDPEYLAAILDPRFLSHGRRGDVENDPSFKQLIPYVILASGEWIFQYRRGAGGGEARLRSQRSIGIGGHISEEDCQAGANPYRVGLSRELAEEVEIASPRVERDLGFIYDPSTVVGQVHLGVVHLWELAEPKARALESALHDASFQRRSELLASLDEFETWSRLALRHAW
jgi:predicted NUDIX family phosphoesterase